MWINIIVDCIGPMVAAEPRQELDKANFVSLTIDASNWKEQGCWRAGTLSPDLWQWDNEGGGAFL